MLAKQALIAPTLANLEQFTLPLFSRLTLRPRRRRQQRRPAPLGLGVRWHSNDISTNRDRWRQSNRNRSG
jgi:hypothetical protein